MRYITSDYAETIPALADLDPDDQAGVLNDAARVHAYLNRYPWITDTDLRAYGERNELPPDRLNAALAVLDQTGQILTLADHPGQVVENLIPAD